MSYTSGQFVKQANHILNESNTHVPINTLLAYDGKIEEFKDFSSKVFPDINFCGLVTEEKFFAFLFYQLYRKPRKRGKKSNIEVNSTNFDLDEYRTIMETENPS
jgi:hypothetical protein